MLKLLLVKVSINFVKPSSLTRSFSIVFLFILDAAYRYYLSCAEAKSSKRRGKLADKNKKKRKHERIVRVSTIYSSTE